MISDLDSLRSVSVATIDGQQLIVVDGQNWDIVTEWLETLEGIEVKRVALAQLKERLEARQQRSAGSPSEQQPND